jgi:hypothetical protein
MKNGARNEMKNDHFSKMDSVSVFDMFPFFIHFLSSFFQVAKGCFHIVHPICCCPIWQSPILSTIHTTEQAKKLRQKTFNGLMTNQ